MASAGVLCKVEYQGDIRRFHLSPCSLETLHSNLRTIFSFDDSTKLRLAYSDPDQDLVTIHSDQDLFTALASSSTSPPSLRLVLLNSTTPLFARASAPAPAVARPSFWCNQCDGAFYATDLRYKCGNCADFDLCARCESVSGHDVTHILLKLTPQAQALHGRFPTDKPILPSAFSSSAPAPAPFDLGSILQSVAQHQTRAGQPNPLGSIFSALQGLQTPSPAATPAAQPDLSALLAGLCSIDFNQLLGQGVGSVDLAQILSQLGSLAQTPSASPAATPPQQPTDDTTSTEQLRHNLLAMGIPSDQIDLALAASGGDLNMIQNLLFPS